MGSSLEIVVLVRNQHRMANSVDPNETARYEPSHQDLHCLQRYLFGSARLKGFILELFCFVSGLEDI